MKHPSMHKKVTVVAVFLGIVAFIGSLVVGIVLDLLSNSHYFLCFGLLSWYLAAVGLITGVAAFPSTRKFLASRHDGDTGDYWTYIVVLLVVGTASMGVAAYAAGLFSSKS
jgi:hypothetical protein